MKNHTEDIGEMLGKESKRDLIAYNAARALKIGCTGKGLKKMRFDWHDHAPNEQLLRQEVERLSEIVDKQASELEALTQMLEEHPVAEYLASLEEYTEQLEFNYLSVVSSTSWKVTSPLRAVVRFFLKKDQPPQFEPRFYGVSRRS